MTKRPVVAVFNSSTDTVEMLRDVFEAAGMIVLTGHIEQISAIASMDFSSGWPITRNFLLSMMLDQTDARLKPGLSGEVTVVVKSADPTQLEEARSWLEPEIEALTATS